MLEKLADIEKNYEKLSSQVIDPDVIADSSRWQGLMKEHAHLEGIVKMYREYVDVLDGIEGAKEIIGEGVDSEMEEMAYAEIKELEEEQEKLEEELKLALIPRDPNDHRNVIVEIRAGAGGDEAALFAGVLYRMYNRFAESQGWQTELMSESSTGIGGFKEVVFMIKGDGAYSKLKYESGVHRVQRVPETESSGRIHTSTVTVAVLPEAEDVDIEINQNDLKIDTFRASGSGGQHVNTTDSAVRITHEPTGIVVSVQDESSQHRNRDKAMRILKTRVYDKILSDQEAEMAAERKGQVGTGDRSERIRTYNYPQGRITDHRINETLHQLENFVDGDLGEMIELLAVADQSEKLSHLNEN